MKSTLKTTLDRARSGLLWKLEGLSEYDIRRPLTGTGTNLLGLVKHLAGVQALYLGFAFGRELDPPLPWVRQDAEPVGDMWATAEESREYILDCFQRASDHGDATIAALDLDSPGFVPWWPEPTNLGKVLVHLTAEFQRHCGHADIVRELIDGSVGQRPDGGDNDVRSVPGDEQWWRAHHDKLERIASEVVTG
ncbi:uncharacterized protein DUF664 [Stackebrandtia endophytica]|uniref:Uncharacterized protein DUF664 n=1 Tax=Stackebrandtia endophytica TaxID=1496996 RepID=A0A543AZZ3_9ACTN|nr:DinB family protein [Stackebrandtia endophytica]TQL78139.1 uncharacterized protein DUF664 [Stackebrandtia endophytica]